MAFRGNEMFKKILKKVKEEKLAPGLKDQLKKYIPDSKVVMGRAKRGLYAGHHIQFGNQISEDGGNNGRVVLATGSAAKVGKGDLQITRKIKVKANLETKCTGKASF